MPPKTTSKWIVHVKNYSQTHGCTYGEALIRGKTSYSGKGQAGGAWYAGKHAGTVRKIGTVAKAFGYGK